MPNIDPCSRAKITTSLASFFANSAGNIVVSFALGIPIILAGVGIAVDFGALSMKQSTLQAASDAAALAGAKELALASSSNESIKASTLAFFTEQLQGKDSAAAVGTVTIDRKLGTVKVVATEDWQPFFAHVLSSDITPVVASSTASLVGASSICVLTLNANHNKAFHMEKTSKLTANGCGVYSNSTHNNGLTVDNSAVLKASLVCSAGGFKQKGTITPAALTDCPPIDDPLASRSGLNVTGCDYTNFKITSGTQTLNPGRYCGGLEVSGTAVATLSSGDYIVKNGPLTVANTAKFTGDHVGFYLSGFNATINFKGDTEISLTGSVTPEMSGLLFFENRSDPADRKHEINSSKVKSLTGTIYLSRGYLLVNPNSMVASQSAYTAIVADRMELSEGLEMVLNSDYGATDVPVPDGIRNAASVVLSN